jgi:hypothetical protein
VSGADETATARRRALLRAILRDPWVEEAERELRSRRRDWKGPRQAIMVRLPDPLAEELRTLAARASLSLSETVGAMVLAFLHRHGRL